MSSASSAVTYTSVYTDSEPGRVFWGADEEIPDGGLPRVIVYGYDGLPMQPVDPPSPDYVPGPEHPSSPDLVPVLYTHLNPLEIHMYYEPEFPRDTLSPGYVPDSDPEEDPEEDSEEHADYPADGGDEPSRTEGGEEEEESSLIGRLFGYTIVVTLSLSWGYRGIRDDESVPTPRPPQIRIPFAQTRLRRAQKTVRLSHDRMRDSGLCSAVAFAARRQGLSEATLGDEIAEDCGSFSFALEREAVLCSLAMDLVPKERMCSHSGHMLGHWGHMLPRCYSGHITSDSVLTTTLGPYCDTRG
ncbi:hypothetical protein Tco_0793193 [Tanacetum coccineum]